jgi:hypothetical protein
VSEFMFRNLSVKLHSPSAGTPGDEAHLAYCPYPSVNCCGCSAIQTVLVVCDPASQSTLSCNALTNSCDPPYGFDTFFSGGGTDGREQLAQLRLHLQRSLAAVDARQQEIENAAKPKSVAEIDSLKSQLLAAVAELDQQRAQMTGEQPPASAP